MVTYTSSLPPDLLARLDSLAKELEIPKNRIIEKALNIYLTEIDKIAYANSFRNASKDEDLLSIAEEGMADYVRQLNFVDEAD